MRLKCLACNFVVESTQHQTQHILFHIMADTLLIELLDEVAPHYYPLQFKKVK